VGLRGDPHRAPAGAVPVARRRAVLGRELSGMLTDAGFQEVETKPGPAPCSIGTGTFMSLH